MNRESLIDKLAMELAEWPDNIEQATRGYGLPSGFYWDHGASISSVYVWEDNVCICGPQEYLQRRAELINKPSWGEAPDGAMYRCQGNCGYWAFFEHEPETFEDAFGWYPPAGGSAWWPITKGAIPAGHDWRQTLERRPTESKEGGVIYAIHRKTKEHRIVPRLDVLSSHDWRYAVADADGWIPHDGRECPLPRGTAVHWRCRDGSEFRPCNALDHPLEWRHGMEIRGEEIVAYRPILDERSEPKPEAVEWDEQGLPAVGAWVEIRDSSEHLKISHPAGTQVKIYAHFTDDRGVELAAFVDQYGKIGGVATAKCFRPIRSEEDRSIEEMTRVLMSLPIATAAYGDTARALYRAGYRKTGGE